MSYWYTNKDLMSQETFWVLFSKKLSGEATDTELKVLESLISEHPEWQYAIQNLEDLWKHQASKDYTQEEDAYLLHQYRMNEMNIPFGNAPVIQAKNRKRKWYWAAAALVIVSVAGFVLLKSQSGDARDKNPIAREENEVSTRRGSKSRVQLPDGTIVLLNGGSKLSYTREFGKELREVTLTGEGFFDVKEMKDKPFIIHTSSINIKVLGTVFNVKAYPEDKKTETSLIRGSIEVTMKNRPNDKLILSPNEKLVVENELISKKETEQRDSKYSPPAIAISKLKYSSGDSTVAETQWVDNKLVFNDESFAEVVLKMERWYDVEIELNDPKLQQKRMTGNFEKETIDQALEALKLTIPFRHEQTGNKIIIHR